MNKENESIRKIKKLLSERCIGLDIIKCISHNIKFISYENLLAQKIVLKIYQSMQLSKQEKASIFEMIVKHYNDKGEALKHHIKFIFTFFPIMEAIYIYLENEIKLYFEDSLFVFNYLIGMYVLENPDMIVLPKKLLLDIAAQILKNDIKIGDLQTKILFAESLYLKKRERIEKIYKEAIQYGCICEKYDDVSYFGSEVISIDNLSIKPIAHIEMYDSNFEMGLHLGSLYNGLQYYERLGTEPEIIHKYYKCKVCRYCNITNQDEENKELIFGYLDRQFCQMSLTDSIYFLTGDMPSYIYSIIAYIYVELMMLIMLSEDNYRIIKSIDIRKNMIFSNTIKYDEFIACISAIFEKQNNTKYSAIPFIKQGDNIIVARWMYNHDLSLVEEVKNIALDARKDKRLGKSADYFGKSVFENVVKASMRNYGWSVLDTSIKVKKTDFDLLAFQNGCVVLGQVKVAHTARGNFRYGRQVK